MACKRQLLYCHTYNFCKTPPISPSSRRSSVYQPSSQILQLRLPCRSNKRHTHHPSGVSIPVNTNNIFKRTKHHSAIPSSQAARQDTLPKLKQRDDEMGKPEFLFQNVLDSYISPGTFSTRIVLQAVESLNDTSHHKHYQVLDTKLEVAFSISAGHPYRCKPRTPGLPPGSLRNASSTNLEDLER